MSWKFASASRGCIRGPRWCRRIACGFLFHQIDSIQFIPRIRVSEIPIIVRLNARRCIELRKPSFGAGTTIDTIRIEVFQLEGIRFRLRLQPVGR